jgi:hypothetical protein
MANKNTNPAIGKTAVPADINNAQPACFPKPHHTWEEQRPRCPQPPKSSYLKNTTITSADFHSSKGPTPGVYKQGNCWQAWGDTEI